MTELHRCKFCGGKMTIKKKLIVDGNDSYKNWAIECERCGCRFSLPGDNYYGRGFFKTQDAAAFAFNIFVETGQFETYGLTKADCKHCSFERGSLKCCDIVDDKLQFHCEAGKQKYEANRYIDRYALMEAFDRYPLNDGDEMPWHEIIWDAPSVNLKEARK